MGRDEPTGRRIRGTTVEVHEAARWLRRRRTPAEHVLWEALRAKRLQGLDFRRQHAVGPLILDFYCPAHRLVVEVDGGVHDRPLQRQRDKDRTEQLEAHGYRVLRFRNAEVTSNLAAVLDRILNEVGAARGQPTP